MIMPQSAPAKAGITPTPMDHRMAPGSMAGHDHGAMIADFLRRFWVCLALSVPLVAGSMMFQNLVGYHFTVPYSTPLLLALATAIFGYGGWPFLSGTVGEMRSRQPGMMTLVAVGITVAYGYSVAVTVGWLRGMDLFMELAPLIDIMLLGHYLEMRSVAGASHALELLVQLLPAEAHQKQGDKINDIKVAALVVGDLVLVRPGERIPTDGEVTDGSRAVNESMLTGESVPVPKEAGGKVIAGAVNGEGALTIRVTHQGADSYLNKVVKMVSEAQQTKSQTQTLADRSAGWLAHGRVAGGRAGHAGGVAVAGQGRSVCHRAHGDGDGHGVSTRAGRGHSAGSGHFHVHLGPQGLAHSQSHGFRGNPGCDRVGAGH